MNQDQRGSEQSPPDPDKSGLLGVYLSDIAKTPLLTAHQEAKMGDAIRAGQAALEQLRGGAVPQEERPELWQTVQQGRQAECSMVQANLRLVVSIANRYAFSSIPFVDLIQEGNIGLLKAVQRFDSSLHYRFSTYATYWIRQAMGRHVAEGSHSIRLPSHVAETMSRLRNVSVALRQSLGRRPNLDELTLATPILSAEDTRQVRGHLGSGAPLPTKLQRRWDRAREQVRTVIELMADPISLETPISDENDALMEEILASDDLGPDQEIMEHVLSDSVAEAIECLSSREQKVIAQRYGLGGVEPRTLQSIGDDLGVTRERVRQIEKKALQRLRASARALALKPFLTR